MDPQALPALRRAREAAIVAAFVCLLFIPFMGKAYHIDEPLFLGPARHILVDPLHPLDYRFNWLGETVPMSRLNTNPPLMFYLLAGAWKLSGGGEWPMRLLLLPLDVLGAVSLYLLAARFLSRPLLPTLIVLASPAYLINMNLLCGEKAAAAFGFFGLYSLCRGLEGRGAAAWYWASAASLAAATMSKYIGLLFLAPALACAWRQGLAPRRIALYAAASLTPLAVHFLADWLSRADALSTAWTVIALSAPRRVSEWVHRLRSFLCFVGGAGVVTAAWPCVLLRPRPGLLAAAAAATLLLLIPVFDIEPVRAVDRVTGALLACGALLGLLSLAGEHWRRLPGWPVWTAWIAAGAAIQLCLYWAVVARAVLFLIPPLVFAAAEQLEALRPQTRLRRLYGVSLAATCGLSLALAVTDARYAAAQRAFAREKVAGYLAQGRKVWFTAHWGLQYYLEEIGASPIDEAAGGWERLRPGDIVLASRVNSNTNLPGGSRLARDHYIRKKYDAVIDCRIPLRLMSGWTGQGGFYANSWGFLPYSVSWEPLDEFVIGEHL